MKFSKLPLIIFLTAVVIISICYIANALDLGVIDIKGVKANGLFLGTSLTKTYTEPISSWTWHSWGMKIGYELDILGIQTRLIPATFRFGTPTDWGYSIEAVYFLPTKK